MNFRLTAKDVRFILFILMILLFTFTKSFSASITSAQSGPWNSTSTWTGGVVPTINDDVTIREADAITINTNANCKTLTITGGSSTSTNISINSGFSLNVTGLLSVGIVSTRTKLITVGAETLTCGGLTFGNNTSSGITRISISTGKLIVNGNITMGGSTTENYIAFSAAGSLLISGSWTTGGTLTLANNCKVVYRGNTAQTIRAVAYRKLQLYGTGVKSLAGTITLGGSAGDSLDIREGATLNATNRTISASVAGIVIQINGNVNTTSFSGLFGNLNSTFLSNNSPIINLGPNSNIEYSNTSAQAITAASYANLTLSGASTKTISAATSVSNELDINAGTLVTGGFLTLKSTATGTARVGTNAGTISGDIIVERFIPGGSNKRKWRFLSSPVNVSGSIAISQYIDDILITAPAGSAAGFDVNPFSPTNTASFRTYDETASGISNNGWTDPTDVTNTIASGIGAEVFVRGTRTLADPYLNWTTPDDVTIDFVGALNSGTISPAITYTPSIGGATTSDGFNLVGNPYASTIDFTNNGLTKTNIDNKFWCYNPNTGSYGVYDMGLNDSTNAITRYIASGQAFFVRANAANPVLSFTEAIKCAAPGNKYFKGNQSKATHSVLHITVNNDSTYSDEALIVLDETASCFSGDTHDAGKLFNDALNIYTLSDDNANLTINALPFIKTIDTIKLAVFSYNGSNIMTTEHRMNFSGIENFDPNKHIYLQDNYTNTITNLSQTKSYTFNITSDNKSWGKNRFSLLFSTNALGISATKSNEKIELYPNPASSEINLKFSSKNSNDFFNYQIIDIYGRIVSEGLSEMQNQQAKINIENIPSGQYFVNVISDTNTSILRFVK